MPVTAVRALDRKAARRRQAATILQIAEATCRYAAGQIGSDRIGPAEAQQTALYVASELEQVADALRRLTRLDGPERRALAVELNQAGWGTKRIAAAVGVSERAVRYYVSGRACPGRVARSLRTLREPKQG